jgi:hypothetical protein
LEPTVVGMYLKFRIFYIIYTQDLKLLQHLLFKWYVESRSITGRWGSNCTRQDRRLANNNKNWHIFSSASWNKLLFFFSTKQLWRRSVLLQEVEIPFWIELNSVCLSAIKEAHYVRANCRRQFALKLWQNLKWLNLRPTLNAGFSKGTSVGCNWIPFWLHVVFM